MIGCTDAELESLRRQLMTCQTKLEKLERDRKTEMELDQPEMMSELETVRERFSYVTYCTCISS